MSLFFSLLCLWYFTLKCKFYIIGFSDHRMVITTYRWSISFIRHNLKKQFFFLRTYESEAFAFFLKKKENTGVIHADELETCQILNHVHSTPPQWRCTYDSCRMESPKVVLSKDAFLSSFRATAGVIIRYEKGFFPRQRIQTQHTFYNMPYHKSYYSLCYLS